ncbi:hypothetical protein N007_15230 [Alicyclobacillus acidoterrestris ATCC 49025]|nr:hypothetical protein N007_15230 [Alicyclobacillus acidoterrestris ATCC 49025]
MTVDFEKKSQKRSAIRLANMHSVFLNDSIGMPLKGSLRRCHWLVVYP